MSSHTHHFTGTTVTREWWDSDGNHWKEYTEYCSCGATKSWGEKQ